MKTYLEQKYKCSIQVKGFWEEGVPEEGPGEP